MAAIHRGNDVDCWSLPPLVGVKVVVVSHALERAHDRARGLESIGYRVTTLGDPARISLSVAETTPDAVVVDLGREVGSPDSVVVALRKDSAVPVVVVGCAGTMAEMLRCLEAGADDYARPRCPTDEIDLRLRAVFRRWDRDAATELPHAPPPVIRVGQLEIDPAGQLVRKAGVIVPLSPTEYRLLATLAEHAGEVVPARALIARVWGNQYATETHYLRLYVRYLRQKLEDDPSQPRYIVNRWGAGYALEAPILAA